MQIVGGVTYFRFSRVAVVSSSAAGFKPDAGTQVTVSTLSGAALVVLDPVTTSPKTLVVDTLAYVEEFISTEDTVRLTAGTIFIEVISADAVAALKLVPNAVSAAQAAQLSAAAAQTSAGSLVSTTREIVGQNTNGTWRAAVSDGSQRQRRWELTVPGSTRPPIAASGQAARIGEILEVLAEPAP